MKSELDNKSVEYIKKMDKLGWNVVIFTTFIMLMGMIIAWNPIYPLKIFGFIITGVGFLFAVLVCMGCIKFKIQKEFRRFVENNKEGKEK